MLLNIKLCFVLIGLTNRKHSIYFISALRKRWVPGAKKLLAPISFLIVRLAAHVSNGCKSRIRPVVGRIQPKARVLQVTANLKEAGCGERTNPRANLWSDGQKSHRRLYMRVSSLPCSDYGGSWREKTMSKLLPYETIVKAHEGDPDAIDTVLSHYAGYIRYFSKVHGQVNAEVEEYVKQQLIAALFKFRFDYPPGKP